LESTVQGPGAGEREFYIPHSAFPSGERSFVRRNLSHLEIARWQRNRIRGATSIEREDRVAARVKLGHRRTVPLRPSRRILDVDLGRVVAGRQRSGQVPRETPWLPGAESNVAKRVIVDVVAAADQREIDHAPGQGRGGDQLEIDP